MNSFQVAEIEDGRKFSGRLILDKSFVLLDPALSFSKTLQKALIEWNFKEAFTEAEEKIPESPKPSVQPGPTEVFETVDLDLNDLIEGESKELNSKFINSIKEANKGISAKNDDERMEAVMSVYESLKDYTNSIFTRYVTHKELKLPGLLEAMKAFSIFERDNKKFLLRITPTSETILDKNFIINHCVRSTIIAIAIAYQIKMPQDKIDELAVATLIHEIGQIKLPPQLYITTKQLSEGARAVLSTHTLLGFNILKENNFPLSIQLGVLDHHERGNGKGYPRHLTSEKISIYGKIISIVCTYEAISSPRHYKQAKTTYEAMLEMLRNNEKQYDETLIKALVNAISLFPIGAYVYLSNGKIAQVADNNPNDPRLPIVKILGEKNELGNPLTVMTDNEKLKISRVLNQNEVKDILAYYNKKQG